MSTRPNQDLDFEIRASATPVPADRRAQLLVAPGFGSVFTDHMATIRWSEDLGWYDARIEPYGPITLDPAAAVFHYGQEIFEGLKAYTQADGSIAAFRPQANAARFNRSANFRDTLRQRRQPSRESRGDRSNVNPASFQRAERDFDKCVIDTKRSNLDA